MWNEDVLYNVYGATSAHYIVLKWQDIYYYHPICRKYTNEIFIIRASIWLKFIQKQFSLASYRLPKTKIKLFVHNN